MNKLKYLEQSLESSFIVKVNVDRVAAWVARGAKRSARRGRRPSTRRRLRRRKTAPRLEERPGFLRRLNNSLGCEFGKLELLI